MCPTRQETLAHVVQQCPRSAHARQQWHNAMVKLLTQKLAAKGKTNNVSCMCTTLRIVQCEMCPTRQETLAHVVQQCPRYAYAREQWHNAVVKLLTQKLAAPVKPLNVETPAHSPRSIANFKRVSARSDRNTLKNYAVMTR